jgi:ArsR family transcriptional regulator, arsenate/arsenite/antimonite-responsive transcriptional repressor
MIILCEDILNMKDYIKILKALGDPARLNLLKVLSGKELCVCEIEEMMNMKQTTVSQQLRRLKEANLVIERKDGWWSYYSLDRNTLDGFLESFKEFFAAHLEEQGEFPEEYRRIEKLSKKAIICRKKEFID